MPAYQFCCDKCNQEFEIVSSISDYSPKQKCPSCKSKRVHRVYDTTVLGSVIKSDNEITLGHLASRNTDRMSDDRKESLQRKHNEYREKKK